MPLSLYHGKGANYPPVVLGDRGGVCQALPLPEVRQGWILYVIQLQVGSTHLLQLKVRFALLFW
jgi:hypothetical protein